MNAKFRAKKMLSSNQTIPKYSKLLDGSHHTDLTNGDPKIARSIIFSINKFTSFQKHHVDDLSYVINDHCWLTAGIATTRYYLYHSFANVSDQIHNFTQSSRPSQSRPVTAKF